jgi:hypothetical protein
MSRLRIAEGLFTVEVLSSCMSSKVTKFAVGIVAVLVVSSLVHYRLFGALPFGKPAMVDDESGDTEDAVVEA